jgi:RND family efflux transporter MFP subunit
MNWHNIITGVLLLSGLTLCTGCDNRENHKTQSRTLPSVAVTVTTAKKEISPSRIEVVGTLEAVENASISSRISGQIIEMPVVLGSKVQKGDLLIKISADEISAKVSQAEAHLSQAKRNLEREKSLMTQGASTKETVKSLEDITRIAQAAYKEAQTMLNFTIITAPFSGTITRKMANIGNMTSPGMVLLQIENGKNLQVLAQIPESLLLQIAVGDKLPVEIPAAHLNLTGEVAEIAPAADPMSRTAPAKINITETPNLRVGQFARISLTRKEDPIITLPKSAIQSKGQMDFIFVADKNTAHMRLIRTGTSQNDSVEIISGLNPGEIVVIENTALLQDGQPLQIKH